MVGQGRLQCDPIVFLLAMAQVLALLWLAQAAGSEIASTPAEILEDAELHDVFFIDADRGWAVGDKGALWTTEDGGRQWQSRRLGVICALHSVHFADEKHGWIAGGWTHPFTHHTSCVILRTSDGGESWQRLPTNGMPMLTRVKFFDAGRGCAMGEPSASYPSGLFRTEDGGRSWSGVAIDVRQPWLAGDFRDPRQGAFFGSSAVGQAVARQQANGWAVMDGNRVSAASGPNLGLIRPRHIELAGRQDGWAAGDGGLVLCTHDGGKSWHPPASRLPHHAAHTFDFSAVAIHHNDVWIAGSPGTCVFHSSDAGRSWETLATGQSLPLRSLRFLDDKRGWAVGALGTILATRDGGRTWLTQRQGGARVALLGVFSEPENIPFELLARVAGNDGYLTAVEVINRRDVEISSQHEDSLARRTHEAVAAVGGSAAEMASQFPLRQRGLQMNAESTLAGWSSGDAGGAQRLKEYLVKKIRQWRPDVIVTEPPSPRGERPASHLVNQIVLEAVKAAADSNAEPQQLREAGLPTWQVKRVFCQPQSDERADIQLVSTSLAENLGKSLSDAAATGRELVFRQPWTPPNWIGFRSLIDITPDRFDRANYQKGSPRLRFFSGIELQAGGEARRKRQRTPGTTLATFKKAVQTRRNVDQLVTRYSQEKNGGAAWLGQIDDLTRGLENDGAAHVIFQLAHRYRETGQLESAAEAFQFLVDRHPHHALSDSALVWLFHYYASYELAWKMGHKRRLTPAPMAKKAAPSSPAGSRRPPSANPNNNLILPEFQGGAKSRPFDLRTVSHERPVARATAWSDRITRARQIASFIDKTRPSLGADPTIRFPLAALTRHGGANGDAQRIFSTLAKTHRLDDWSTCARAETWLARPTNVPPKPGIDCMRSAGEKPRLDGELDDEMWQTAQPVDLRSLLRDDVSWPATAMLAHDDEFLYFAAICNKAPSADYPPTSSPRPRDADLESHDRIDLLIDVDRDWATHYRLTVDHRGWTSEACHGDKSWNPHWFVAARSSGPTWTIEAAIPLNQLTGNGASPAQPWAIGIQRTVPRVGFQSWTQPAAIQPRPEGFGLLFFRTEPSKR